MKAQLEDNSLRSAFEPIRLPCGREVQNRFVKVSLYEHLCPLWGGLLNDYHYTLYSRWSKGKWGMIFTGNVQVSPRHLTLGRDIIVPEAITPNAIAPFKRLADVIHGITEDGVRQDKFQPLAIMQLSHGGRQSPPFVGGRPMGDPALAPSSIGVGSEIAKTDGILIHMAYRMLFPTTKEMTTSEIDEVVDMFVRGAQVAIESGFDGVELHAAHGYLLAAFISTKYNKRKDEYSATTSPLRLVHRIVTKIREIAPREFVVGIKLNAADYVDAQVADDTTNVPQGQEDRSLSHVTEMASWGMVDFIEVSGGDYENPEFLGVSRQAFFSRFSRRAMKALSTESLGSQPPPLIMLTGGLRSPSTFASAIADNHAHFLGVGRLGVICPDLPVQVKAQGMKFIAPPEPDFMESTVDRIVAFMGKFSGITTPRLIGMGRQGAWYSLQMRELSQGREIDYGIGGMASIVMQQLWWLPRLNGSGTERDKLSEKYSRFGLGNTWNLSTTGLITMLLVVIISWYTFVTMRE